MAEVDADDFADAVFFHGDAVDDVCAGDGAFVVGDDEELALGDEAVEDFDEAFDIGFVEGGVHFVEDAEGAGLDHVDSEEESDGGHGAFAAGEEADVLEFFARGFSDDFDTGFEGVVGVEELEGGFSATEELGEHFLEVGADFLEGLGEEFFGGLVDALDEVGELLFGVGEVEELFLEEVVVFEEFVVFFDGVEVDWAEGFDALGELGDFFFDEVPGDVGGVVGRGEELEECREVGFEGFEVDLVFAEDLFGDIFEVELGLGELDLEVADLFVEVGDFFVVGEEGRVGFFEEVVELFALVEELVDGGDDMGEALLVGGDLVLEGGDFFLEGGDFCFEGLVFFLTGIEEVGEFDEAGLDGFLLAEEGLVALLFGSDLDADLVELFGLGGFEFAEGGEFFL